MLDILFWIMIIPFLVTDTINLKPPTEPMEIREFANDDTHKITIGREVFLKDTADRLKQIEETKEEEARNIAAQEAQACSIEEPIEATEPTENVGSSYLISISNYERDLLERLVECEAGDEPFSGKVAVVQVVLNRITSTEFPNTIEGVVYQSGQFQPAMTGILEGAVASDDDKRAVELALQGENIIGDCVYFWADYVDSSNSIWEQGVRMKVGSHVFSGSIVY